MKICDSVTTSTVRGRMPHFRDALIEEQILYFTRVADRKNFCQTLGPASKRVLPDLSTFCQTYLFLEIF
jgi:hypothetical protein